VNSMPNLPYDLTYEAELKKYTKRIKNFVKENGIKNLIVFGAGEKGRVLIPVLISCGVSLEMVIDDNVKGDICGIPVRDSSALKSCVAPVLIAVEKDHPKYPSIISTMEEKAVKYYEINKVRMPQIPSPVWLDRRISKFRDIHKGERCVIIGNGPSLNKIDFELLKDEYTFGLNKIYLLFEEKNFKPNYVCCLVKEVAEQCYENYLKLDMPIFLSRDCMDVIPKGLKEDIYYLGEHKRFSFSLDIVKNLCNGFTVTYLAMQVAFYMGFEEVILIGVDHNFGYSGDPDKWIVEGKPENMHFHPDYFQKDQVWQSPNLFMSETHYRLARDVYKHFGRRIIDATIDGKLDIFEKGDLRTILGK